MTEQTLDEAIREQREYERKRGILIDEALLIVTLMRQKMPAGVGLAPVTGDGVLLAAATIYAGWMAHGEAAQHLS